MTAPEILASELNAFLARRDAKFAEICNLLGEQLEKDELGGLSEEQRAAITEKAEEHIETWQAKPALAEGIANATPLQRLLAEYCQIETEIMKREDEIAARSDALDDDDDDDDDND